jgi:hypothetical protein
VVSSVPRPVHYEWRGSFTNEEVNALHAEAFDHFVFDDDWIDQLSRLSLGWVIARDAQGLVGFVNIIWDGLTHAFVEDTAVALRARRRGRIHPDERRIDPTPVIAAGLA